MQPLSNQGADASVEIPSEVLSAAQAQNQELLAHLQTALPSPLDLLMNGDNAPPSVLLNNVTTQQALPVEEKKPQPDKVTLGKESRLSDCMLWDLQAAYYQSKGVNAWQQSIPSFVTSSTYIAEAYAEMILAFVEDYFEHLDLNEPLYILEMATGTGRFSHLLLKELEVKLGSFAKTRAIQLRYIMTDFTESTPNFWQQHEKLKPFVDKGILDFAVFNPVENQTLTLRHSGEVLQAGQIKNPLIAIGNYFFDTIKQDVFRVESKVLKEGLVTLERSLEGVEESSPPHISQISTQFRFQDLRSDRYYSDDRLNAILKHYKHQVKNGTILFPIGAFDVLRNLEALSGNQLVLISSDKAYTQLHDMTRLYKHDFARHDGAFSYMVNYHAIGEYFKNAQGQYFCTDAYSYSIQTVCCVRVNQSDVPLERLDYLYRQKLNRANQINSVCAIMPGRDDLPPAGEVNQLIAHIRLNLADSQIFFMLGQQLVDLIPQGLQSHHQDLFALMEQTWENYYYFPGEANIPFWFAQIYYVLSRHEQSLTFLDHAMRYFGEHEVLYFLKGQNYEKLNQWRKAEAAYQKALSMKADFPEAQEALANVESVLRG